jgi:hypothetical protein
MATLVAEVSLRKTELYSRQKVFGNTYGIKVAGGLSSLDISLDQPYELPQVSNFLLISTDSTIDMIVNQVVEVTNDDGSTEFKTQTVTLPVTGIFMTYANFGKVRLQRNSNIARVPKVTVMYS